MKRNYLLPIALIVVLLSLTLAACGGAPTESSAIETAEVTIAATDIAYGTNELTVSAGQPVKVSLQNDGALVHDFSISVVPVSGKVVAEEGMGDDHSMMEGHDMTMEEHGEAPAVHVAAAPGTIGTVTFTPSTPGTYEYYCTVEGHKEAGMAGTLVVEP